MGAALNIWQSRSKRITLDGIYHHQSCILSRDRNSYDALGVRMTWRFWER